MTKQIAAVTGCSRGIGKTVALRLAKAGYKILLLGRASKELDETKEEIVSLGGEAEIILIDLLDSKHCSNVLANQQRLDVLVNCAIYQGPGENSRFDKLELEEYNRLYTGNVLSQVALIQSVLPGMLQRNCGCVFQLVSASSIIPPVRAIDKGGFQAFGYVSTKAAIAKLVPLLRLEHANSQVRFFNIDPGLVLTDKMHREGTASKFAKYGANSPDAAAEAIAMLATAAHDDAMVKEYNGKDSVNVRTLFTSKI